MITIAIKISVPPAPPIRLGYDEKLRTLTIQCQWEDETAKERTGQLVIRLHMPRLGK